jgi:N-acyl-D-amino-acid deacylase
MLSWADGTLLQDGRAMSDVLQGVTLEVFGEGWSPGPRKRKPGDPGWTTLGGYFDHLQKKGISPNVASFVGATTVRAYVMGYENRKPTPTELQQMKNLVKSAMQEGAMGVGSSLIYAPATFADTDELIALCKVAADHGGMYITHMRSESDDILKAIDETIQIARQADIPAEIYHIKINQQRNWPKIDPVLSKIDSARKAGLSITANFYPYTASATGLKERIPNWAQEGGVKALRGRIRNPQTRTKILYDMEHGIPSRNSDPADVMLLGFSKDSLQQLYAGKRLDEVARLHGKNADETVLDIISKDPSSSAIYFLMSEDNSTRFLQQPYVSIGSDAGAPALTPEFTKQGIHPRAYGTFARVLNYYVREKKVLTLEEAIHRMTGLPAANLRLNKRGLLRQGYFADIAIFDPANIRDNATFEQPHQYATGVSGVLVNGVVVVKDGVHIGAMPGLVVKRKKQ